MGSTDPTDTTFTTLLGIPNSDADVHLRMPVGLTGRGIHQGRRVTSILFAAWSQTVLDKWTLTLTLNYVRNLYVCQY